MSGLRNSASLSSTIKKPPGPDLFDQFRRVEDEVKVPLREKDEGRRKRRDLPKPWKNTKIFRVFPIPPILQTNFYFLEEGFSSFTRISLNSLDICYVNDESSYSCCIGDIFPVSWENGSPVSPWISLNSLDIC
ncbi:hypothetical protein CEXT_745711 [Caerostris extrusa]|uniref:Uncharacterized protein n=1 Tax=Caerostris extrusa TaxID=172846 RepID=A0AAV4TK79_CAEEX|nr:hypothetical protein CEXT_745711 [Caerostris extrusa]